MIGNSPALYRRRKPVMPGGSWSKEAHAGRDAPENGAATGNSMIYGYV